MSISSGVLFHAVYSDVSEYLKEDYFNRVPSEITYKQFASSHLLESVTRKWVPDNSKDLDTVAYNAFIEANHLCKDWRLPDLETIDEIVLNEIRKDLDDFFHPGGEPLVSSYYDILRRGKSGPGFAVGSVGTSFYTKYMASPLAATSEYLYSVYKDYASWIPFLSDADCQRYEKFGPPRIVSGSRCTFVPKTSKTSRMVCIEPSLNMFFQLGFGAILEDRLREFFGISLESQPDVNRRLACSGSKDGSLATIDLKSASDSVSIRLCETLLPKWVFDLLLTLRSRTTDINGQSHALFMISTMGNGFTFPLQTIIFTSLLRAVHRVFMPGTPLAENLSCFGDDLICRREIYDRVIHYLKMFGFKPNISKSFNEGAFRESCGTDWFFGQPVRPVFIKKIRTLQDIFVAINLFNEWSAYTGIPLRNTCQLLFNSISPKFRYFVPFVENSDCGIRVPLRLLTSRKYDSNHSFIYRKFESKPFSYKVSEGSIRSNSKRGEIFYNPDGLYVSFLFGELVSMSISVRHNSVRYGQRRVCSPFWDYIPASSFSNGVKLVWQQWETAVAINLAKP